MIYLVPPRGIRNRTDSPQRPYIRVSTLDQNTERQLDGVSLDKTFEDKASGKDTARPKLQEALEYLREGDTLHIHSMDRLARNLDDLKGIVKRLTATRGEVQCITEGPAL